MDVIHRHEDATGERVMYACNVTGTVDEMLERHDAVKDAGGNCVMVSLQSVGLAAVQTLRARPSPYTATETAGARSRGAPGSGSVTRHTSSSGDSPASTTST